MNEYIPKALRARIAAQARHRCGYCLTSEAIVGAPMEINHIVPRSLGGLTEEGNLWLACPLCNEHKGVRTVALDPLTGEMVPLFNPRRQAWQEHFAWTAEGDRIIGLTAIGRATVIALNLNRPSLVKARQAWVAAGWHPPKD
ncbi:MAG: HNH endonuclease [candidate division KSB1 bacterium]|nr:HNH endonuclease [candidate division KSB1 bacterium]